MVWTGRADRTQQAAAILVKTGAALEEVFRYYKFERYGNTFPEKPYFLLSHCAHLLFSLWLADQDSEGSLFQRGPRPVAFTAGLDFASLRYADYNRRTVHGEALEEHLKNEPKWFEFWMKALERLDPAATASVQEFSRQVLAHTGQRSFLDGKGARRDHRDLNRFLATDEAGRVLVRTISVLEDAVWTGACCFVTLDARRSLIEQVTALICLLHQVRRIIICESPARGPCVPAGIRGWGMPWRLARIRCARTRGTLVVVPKRNGGEIVCTYKWATGSQTCSRSWTVKASALSLPYEQELFGTWSYDMGEHLRDLQRSSEMRACWTVQTAEAGRLEDTARRIDMLLRALAANPQCRSLVETVAGVLRNNSKRWKPVELPWTYIKSLDRLLSKLTFVCREAKVVGGDNSAEAVINRIWPVPPTGETPEPHQDMLSCEADEADLTYGCIASEESAAGDECLRAGAEDGREQLEREVRAADSVALPVPCCNDNGIPDEAGTNQHGLCAEPATHDDRQELAGSDDPTDVGIATVPMNDTQPESGPGPSSVQEGQGAKPSPTAARGRPLEILLERMLRPQPPQERTGTPTVPGRKSPEQVAVPGATAG